ncbi:hypothetical protein BGW80DRAFT_194031 [Lactifluus volemus]|nr:hypothetical protein BGW80DRAFT_194031 [Lactifluus volemus]
MPSSSSSKSNLPHPAFSHRPHPGCYRLCCSFKDTNVAGESAGPMTVATCGHPPHTSSGRGLESSAKSQLSEVYTVAWSILCRNKIGARCTPSDGGLESCMRHFACKDITYLSCSSVRPTRSHTRYSTSAWSIKYNAIRDFCSLRGCQLMRSWVVHLRPATFHFNVTHVHGPPSLPVGRVGCLHAVCAPLY